MNTNIRSVNRGPDNWNYHVNYHINYQQLCHFTLNKEVHDREEMFLSLNEQRP